MTNKNLFKKYNKKNNLIIISEYLPVQTASTGLGWYTSNTQKSLTNGKTIIITNKKGKNDEIYEENNSLIIRCFEKNNPLSLFKIVNYVFKLNNTKNVLFEFEFASYGNIFSVSIIPFILFLFKLLGNKTYFALHQVADNLNRLNSHLGLSKNSPAISILNIGLAMFYRSIGLLSTKVIVLEEEFKQRISKYINSNKILYVPIGISNLSTKSYNNLRLKMNLGKNDFIIMVFGYIAWYKGIDRLIESFNGLPNKIKGRNLKLIIAGGYSQAQAGKSHYEKYFQSIKNKANNNKRISITGFVPEENVSNYYSVADLCMIPYREFISSSGPLSLALSYQRPVILSKELQNYTESADFNKAMKSSGLDKNDMFIEVNSKELMNKINRLITNGMYQKQLIKFSKKMGFSRSWKHIGQIYNKIIIKNSKKVSIFPKFSFKLKSKNLLITS